MVSCSFKQWQLHYVLQVRPWKSWLEINHAEEVWSTFHGNNQKLSFMLWSPHDAWCMMENAKIYQRKQLRHSCEFWRTVTWSHIKSHMMRGEWGILRYSAARLTWAHSQYLALFKSHCSHSVCFVNLRIYSTFLGFLRRVIPENININCSEDLK